MHKLALTNGAARWLAIYLNAQGIFTSTSDVFLVGTLLGSHLEPDLNLPKEKLEDEAWWEAHSKGQHSEFEISEAQREAIKRGLKELAKKAALQTNKFTVEIISTFGLQDSNA